MLFLVLFLQPILFGVIMTLLKDIDHELYYQNAKADLHAVCSNTSSTSLDLFPIPNVRAMCIDYQFCST